MITKNTTPGVAMVKTARRCLTSENASKRVHFCRSRCCFAHAIDRKNTQKNWKSSKVSTVGPAARRANSKCIFDKNKIALLPTLIDVFYPCYCGQSYSGCCWKVLKDEKKILLLFNIDFGGGFQGVSAFLSRMTADRPFWIYYLSFQRRGCLEIRYRR